MPISVYHVKFGGEVRALANLLDYVAKGKTKLISVDLQSPGSVDEALRIEYEYAKED